MRYLIGTALTALATVAMCSHALAQPSTLPPHGSVGGSPGGGYNDTRVYSPSTYTDTTQNIQVNFTLTPNSNVPGSIQMPYASEQIELGVRDPNNSGSTGPINYVSGTRTIVNPSTCVRSGVDNRTLNCNAVINFPASLRNGDNHLVYIRYMATSVYAGNTSLNWTGYYTIATMLSCSPSPACHTMGQPTPTTLTSWPTNSEGNPFMPTSVDANGNFIFDLDFSDMSNLPPECADPMDPAYDPMMCMDPCLLEGWTDMCMGPSPIFFIDPPIATGYDYTVTGTSFTDVKAPSLGAVNDPDGYTLSYLNAGVAASQTLLPGQDFSFPSAVSNFSISGISPSLSLDPSDTAIFPMGVSLAGIPQAGPSTIRITQAPVTTTPTPSLPTANAGADETVTAPGNVKLNGAASTDPLGGPLTYQWTQVAGPTVALINPQSATPNFWTLNVLSPTTLSFELKVEGSSGNQSVADQVDIVLNPSPKMPQCTPWNRNELVASLSAYPQGSGYSVTHTIDGQVKTDLQNLANSLASQHATFGRFEIKSYIGEAGTGTSPALHGNTVSSMSPQSIDFTSPATPAPATFWTGGHFAADTWYRWDTKINLWRANGYSLDGVNYGDDCVYQTAYFKIDGTNGTLQTRSRNRFRRLMRPTGQLNFGDVKTPFTTPRFKPVLADPRDLPRVREFPKVRELPKIQTRPKQKLKQAPLKKAQPSKR